MGNSNQSESTTLSDHASSSCSLYSLPNLYGLPSLSKSASSSYSLRTLSKSQKKIFKLRNSLKQLIPSSSNKSSSNFQVDPDEKIQNENNSQNKYVSTKIVQIAADFWNLKINGLTFEKQLEIGVTIYLGMMVQNGSMKQIFKQNFCHNEKISALSLKFLNMMGWLIRALLQNSNNLPLLFSNLGRLHRQCGIDIHHFGPMLQSLHETFTHYFPESYQIQQKYAIDYIFTLATKMMMGECGTLQSENADYLQSLDICLKSLIGREYLFRYLQQTWCDELVVYLQAIMKFKNEMSDKGRYFIARNIIEVSIDSNSNLSLNLSYETRQNALNVIQEFEHKYFCNEQEFEMRNDVFKDVTTEIYKLIRDNHWRLFVKNIKNMNENNNLLYVE